MPQRISTSVLIFTAVAFAVLAALPAYASCPGSGTASCIFRSTDTNSNLSRNVNSDGDTQAGTVDGLTYRTRAASGDNYVYMEVADGWMQNCNSSMYLRVFYYDESSSFQLVPEYDKSGGAAIRPLRVLPSPVEVRSSGRRPRLACPTRGSTTARMQTPT